ncbi:MAG: hypothetical protein A2V88_13915 [Elusimicrobia bacterium RBG_16_66_12]|nr:MAG: hypothetical protein A2V88_13915 [Elusimicrobia bacterium RBG_16_66_12]
MEKNSLSQTVCGLFVTVLAVLLLVAPSARAAKTRNTRKADPEASRLMSEGLGSLERGETSAAISALNKAVRRQGTVSSYFLLGWAHYQRGFKLGSTEAADRDDAQSAIDAYTMALSLDPALTELPDRSRLYFSMALCYEAVESYDRALNAYKMALSAAPSKALIPVHAARLRMKMKDTAKVMANIEMALKKAIQNGQEKTLRDQVRRDPAFAPLIANNETRKALGIAAADFRGEEMRDAVRDTPKRAAPAQDPAVLEKISAGNIEFKFRRYLSAVAAYNEALAIDSERATLGAARTAAVYERIGAAYNKVGQSESALQALQKSLQQDPMNADARYQTALAYAVSGKTASALRAVKEAFSSAANTSELRRLVLLAKTDVELEAVRDLPGFRPLVAEVAGRIALR